MKHAKQVKPCNTILPKTMQCEKAQNDKLENALIGQSFLGGIKCLMLCSTFL